jgi:hypothetical protein
MEWLLTKTIEATRSSGAVSKRSMTQTDELRSVKGGRTIGEYCWTLTPFAPRFVFAADASVERVTYIDADVWFRKHPRPLIDAFEASGKQVLITDHGYAPEYDQSAVSGQYCVQYMTFSRGGESVRKWWEARCLEWCFARVEDGRFGDQRYLDDWPERFADDVYVLRDKESELVLAPWNATRFPYGNAVLYHFHGLRLISRERVEMGDYLLPKPIRENVYQPYLSDLKQAMQLLNCAGHTPLPQTSQIGVMRRTERRLRRLMAHVWMWFADSERSF